MSFSMSSTTRNWIQMTLLLRRSGKTYTKTWRLSWTVCKANNSDDDDEDDYELEQAHIAVLRSISPITPRSETPQPRAGDAPMPAANVNISGRGRGRVYRSTRGGRNRGRGRETRSRWTYCLVAQGALS